MPTSKKSYRHVVVLRKTPEDLNTQQSLNQIYSKLNIIKHVRHTTQEFFVALSMMPQVDVVYLNLEHLKSQEKMDIANVSELIHIVKTMCKHRSGSVPYIALHSDGSISRDELMEVMRSNTQAITIHPKNVEMSEVEIAYATILAGKPYFSPLVYQILRGETHADKTNIISYSPVSLTAIASAYLEKVTQELPVAWHNVQSYGELFTKLSVTPAQIVVVDIDAMVSAPDCNLLDIANSIHILAKATSTHWPSQKNNLRLYAIAGADTDIHVIRELLKMPSISGIVGVAGNDFTYDEIKSGILAMLEGKYHIPQPIHQKLDEKKVKRVRRDSVNKPLTGRQQQILNLVCKDGASNKAIANKLKITESTVKLHLGLILKKYKLRNRTQLVLSMGTNHTTDV